MNIDLGLNDPSEPVTRSTGGKPEVRTYLYDNKLESRKE